MSCNASTVQYPVGLGRINLNVTSTVSTRTWLHYMSYTQDAATQDSDTQLNTVNSRRDSTRTYII